MKRILSLLLTFIMVFSLCGTILAQDVKDATITVQDAIGFPSQTVSVVVRIDETYGLSAATLKIKYDKRLELISVENGDFFTNIADSAIYMQDTAGVNGEYLYIGINDGDDLAKVRGEFVKLNFKIPADAEEGEEFKVEIDKKASLLTTGTDSSKKFDLVNGKITSYEANHCGGNHTFGEDVVLGTASFLSTGYKYRICTACRYTETEYQPATEIRAYEYLGTSINYTGKPSGIAPMFKVDENALNYVKTVNSECNVEAGIVVYKNGIRYDEEVFFGNGATYSLVDNVLFVKVNNVSAYDEFTFKAYVKITNESTGEERIAYTIATVDGSEEISICDVTKKLNLKSYSKENRAYLQNILDGFAD
ncbi:MAG: hypothetical protein IKA02_00955 [Clostridia bacterium]|nr:hypothetical protein [Clostridia bacterium]